MQERRFGHDALLFMQIIQLLPQANGVSWQWLLDSCEAVITRYPGLPKNTQYGPSEALTALIYCIKRSYGGMAWNKISTGLSDITPAQAVDDL